MIKYKHVLICTGEVSGDMHGGMLAEEIRKQSPDTKISALGSTKLREAGATIIQDISKRSTIGFLETLVHIPILLRLKQKLSRLLRSGDVDLLICIDYQGFNMIMAGIAKKHGVKVVYFIPPQEWIWGSEKGVKQVVNSVDKIITIFQEEYEAYHAYTENVVFYGHPLLQIIDEYKKGRQQDIIRDPKLIAVFPGSRKQEIQHIFPEMIKIMQELILIDTEYKFIINLPNEFYLKSINKGLQRFSREVPIYIGRTYEVMEKSSYAVLTSGTICLEAVLLNLPHVVLYKFGKLSFKLVKKVMKKFRYKNYSLTNILAGAEVVNEYLQDFTAKEVAGYVHSIIINKEKTERLRATFLEIKDKLQVDEKHIIFKQIVENILT